MRVTSIGSSKIYEDELIVTFERIIENGTAAVATAMSCFKNSKHRQDGINRADEYVERQSAVSSTLHRHRIPDGHRRRFQSVVCGVMNCPHAIDVWLMTHTILPPSLANIREVGLDVVRSQ